METIETKCQTVLEFNRKSCPRSLMNNIFTLLIVFGNSLLLNRLFIEL